MDEWLTLRESAAELKLSYSTVTKWTARGEFVPEAIKLPNGQWRVRRRDLTEWMEAMRPTS